MPEDEREALLEALKAKWDTVNFGAYCLALAVVFRCRC